MADAKLQAKFKEAVEKVRNAPTDGTFKPSNEYKLRMYALYRQATDGDVQGKRPGLFDVVGRFKYEAWEKLCGTGRDQAMQQYIAEVEQVEARHS